MSWGWQVDRDTLTPSQHHSTVCEPIRGCVGSYLGGCGCCTGWCFLLSTNWWGRNLFLITIIINLFSPGCAVTLKCSSELNKFYYVGSSYSKIKDYLSLWDLCFIRCKTLHELEVFQCFNSIGFSVWISKHLHCMKLKWPYRSKDELSVTILLTEQFLY